MDLNIKCKGSVKSSLEVWISKMPSSRSKDLHDPPHINFGQQCFSVDGMMLFRWKGGHGDSAMHLSFLQITSRRGQQPCSFNTPSSPSLKVGLSNGGQFDFATHSMNTSYTDLLQAKFSEEEIKRESNRMQRMGMNLWVQSDEVPVRIHSRV